MTTPTASRLTWIPQLLAAFVLGQTLFFKFSGAPESVALFEALGAEPWGRWGTGIAELVAVVLLLVPRVAALGGLLTAGLMVGAVGAHVFVIGILWDGDATLFVMALVALVSGLAVAWSRRDSLPGVGARRTGAPDATA